MTLARLHCVLSEAMEWRISRGHEFQIGGRRYGDPASEPGFSGPLALSRDSDVPLFSVLGRAGATAVYLYQSGNVWELEVVLEKVLPPDPAQPCPVCLSGERRSPPEDFGGITGYYDLLESIRNPEHEQHKEMVEWVGEDFDPEIFSAAEVNRAIAPVARPH